MTADEGRAAARRAEMERQVRASGACEAFQGAMGQEHCQRCGRNEHLHWLRELLFWGGRSPSRTRQNAEALLGRVGGVITLSTADDVTRFCEAIVREALALSGQQPCAECDRRSRAVEAARRTKDIWLQSAKLAVERAEQAEADRDQLARAAFEAGWTAAVRVEQDCDGTAPGYDDALAELIEAASPTPAAENVDA
jgi:hypothetical protein